MPSQPVSPDTDRCAKARQHSANLLAGMAGGDPIPPDTYDTTAKSMKNKTTLLARSPSPLLF